MKIKNAKCPKINKKKVVARNKLSLFFSFSYKTRSLCLFIPISNLSKNILQFFFSLSLSIMSNKTILVTGGAGYIGSHTVLQLLLGGYNAVVVDNLDNSSQKSIDRVKKLAGEFAGNLSFHKVRSTFSRCSTIFNSLFLIN